MNDFHVHQLRVSCQVETPIVLNEHKGSALRGALYHALRGSEDPRATWSGFCANKQVPHCYACQVSAVCPVMRLVSTLDDQGTHGHEAPRPYVINPPLDDGRTVFAVGDYLTFDVLLAGDAEQLLPYVVLALDRLAYEGLGAQTARSDGRWRRGTARIARIDAVHPLTGESRPVFRANARQVQVPRLPITHADVLAAAAQLPRQGMLTLHFITPLRLIEHEQLVKTPYFRPLMHRLAERLKSLAEHFGSGGVPFDVGELRDLADGVALVENESRWVDLCGFSSRLGRPQMLGGLVGRAVYQCDDWAPFLPWLVWGTVIHVGKNAVKGEGWLGIEAGACAVGLPGVAGCLSSSI
jgi:hypothetical protein